MAQGYPHIGKTAADVYVTDRGKAIRGLLETLQDEDSIKNLRPNDAEMHIKRLDDAFQEDDFETTQDKARFATLICTLRRLSGIHARLPTSVTTTEEIEVTNEILESSSHGDTRKGNYKGNPVAVKNLRVDVKSDQADLRKKFYEQVVLWNRFSHKNVLKLFGAHVNMEKGQFVAVSELMVESITQYIKKNQVNRLDLLHQAAQGLQYLHGLGVAHGDINGDNIVISNDTPHRACLANFDSSTVVLDPFRQISGSSEPGGLRLFMAPELSIPPEFGMSDSIPTPEADIYAFGLVIFQVLTGENPFRGIRTTELPVFVLQGHRPDKPTNASVIGFSDSLWNFTEDCWNLKDLRPKVAQVVACLEAEAEKWHEPMYPCCQAESVAHAEEDGLDFMGLAQLFEDRSAVEESSTGLLTSELPDGYWSDEGSSNGHSSGTLSSVATPVLAPRNDFGSFILSQAERLHEEPEESKKNSFQLPVKKRGGLVSKFFPKFTPSRRSTTDASLTSGPSSSSALVQSPNPLSSDVAKMITEAKGNHQTQELVNRFDEVLENTICDHDRRELLNALCKMCCHLRSIPNAMHIDVNLDGNLTETYFRGNSDVFIGQHKGRAVAVKMLHFYVISDREELIRRFIREAVGWRHLRHPNILPLLGVSMDEARNKCAMISEWMDNGNINEFVERTEGVNRVQLLVDATTGLEYMHGLGMVHGDLKGANILINNDGRACLADFGLSTIVGVGRRGNSYADSKASLMSFTPGGTTRWMSPELLNPEAFGCVDDRPTKQSDVYALGMVVYEVLCGHNPYCEISSEALVMNSILEGEQPQKPNAAESLGFTKGLWDIVTRCWSVDINARPDVALVLSHLNHATWSRGRGNWCDQITSSNVA